LATGDHVADDGQALGASRQALELHHLDTDRKHTDAHRASAGDEGAAVAARVASALAKKPKACDAPA
jgi:hypothetical protein